MANVNKTLRSAGINLGSINASTRQQAQAIEDLIRQLGSVSNDLQSQARGVALQRRGTQGFTGIKRIFEGLSTGDTSDAFNRMATVLEAGRLAGPALRVSNLLRRGLASSQLLGTLFVSSLPFTLAKAVGGNQDYTADLALKAAKYLIESPLFGGALRALIREETQRELKRVVAEGAAAAAQADPSERLRTDPAFQRFAGEAARRDFFTSEEAKEIQRRAAQEASAP